jgi:hypothetical protein
VAFGAAASIGDGGHGRQDYQGRQKSPATLHLHYKYEKEKKKERKKNTERAIITFFRERESSRKLINSFFSLQFYEKFFFFS